MNFGALKPVHSNDLVHGTIQDDEIFNTRNANLVLGDNGFYLTIAGWRDNSPDSHGFCAWL